MCNMGIGERVIRVILGLIILSLVFWLPKSAWGWLGLIPLLTGISGFCPLYRVLGINKSAKSKESTVQKPC